MKANNRILFFFVAALTAAIIPCSCGNTANGQQASSTLCGGYTECRQISADEMDLFKSLVPQSDTTYTPISVASQVVAGINYKFLCSFVCKEAEIGGQCLITIFKPLQGDPVITEIGRPAVIDFSNMEEMALKNFKGGENTVYAKMFYDGVNRVMKGHLDPGASIGRHTHENDSEILFVNKGSASVVFDGVRIELHEGDVHYCPKGHSHTIFNDGKEKMYFTATVVSQ